MVSIDQVDLVECSVADPILKLRRIRQRLAPSSTDEVDTGSNDETTHQRPSIRDNRAASEPTENILASIPYHAREDISHQHSVANSSFSRVGLQRVSSSQVPFISGEPFGLSIVHDSQNADVDFIFVHGLGGSSYRTWSWNRDTDHFWPQWLSLDPELGSSRIFTFGYNANIKGSGSNLNIIDFARDLLLRMLTFSGGNAPAQPIGTVRWIGTCNYLSAKLADSNRSRTRLSLLLILWAA